MYLVIAYDFLFIAKNILILQFLYKNDYLNIKKEIDNQSTNYNVKFDFAVY